MNEIVMIITNVVLGLLGASFGLVIADIDQNIPYIKHRSFLTHGLFVPLYIFYQTDNYFNFGFLAGYAVHLVYDMWPREWVGIAKIHVISHYRLWGVVSFVWLGATVMSAIWVMTKMAHVNIVVISLLACFVYKSKSEEKIIMAGVTLVCLTILSVYLGSLPLTLPYSF